MARYIISGGARLSGNLRISGNKNSILPCIAACLLTKDKVTLHNVPAISDVGVMVSILEQLGVKVERFEHSMSITAEEINSTDLPESLTNKLRGSVLLAGSLLSRKGEVTFSHPGGDVIGKRGIELHLEGFKRLGYGISMNDRQYKAEKSHKEEGGDCNIFLEIPTVTGTENLILASVLRNGTSTIRNCAQEPHIVDLCDLLSAMGAKIEGTGTNKLVITGVGSLHGADFTVGADFTEFGTYAIAAAMTGGQVTLQNCTNLDLDPILWPLRKMGIKFDFKDGGEVTVSADKLTSIDTLKTNIWPGFPTDLMSAIIALATQAEGASLLHDWMYESRMFFVDKLISMGADITIADPHRVLVYGPANLRGRELETPDIRAGMALVLAALTAKGESIIHRAQLIERGYEDVVGNLSRLGANIRREE